MSVRSVRQIGDPVLRLPSIEVPPQAIATAPIRELIRDLLDTMRHAGGAGIAANQIGRRERVCAVCVDDNPRYPYKPPIPLSVLINPELEPLSEETFPTNEGCLSVPFRGDLERFMSVRVRGLDGDGVPVELSCHGLTAATFQHEIDHLDGTLFVDRVTDPRSFADWEGFEKYQRAAFLERIEPAIRRSAFSLRRLPS